MLICICSSLNEIGFNNMALLFIIIVKMEGIYSSIGTFTLYVYFSEAGNL